MSKPAETTSKPTAVVSATAAGAANTMPQPQAVKPERLTMKTLEQLKYKGARNVGLFACRNGVEAMLFTVPAKLLTHFSPTLKRQLDQNPTLRKIDLDFPNAHVKWLYTWMEKGGEVAKYEPFESQPGKELEDQEILKRLAECLEIEAVIQHTNQNIETIKKGPVLPPASKTAPKEKVVTCYHCKEAGHIKRACPKKPARGPPGPCPKCGETGHWSKDCEFSSDWTILSGRVMLKDQFGYKHTFPLRKITCDEVGAEGSGRYELFASARVLEWDLAKRRTAQGWLCEKKWEQYMDAFKGSESTGLAAEK